MCSVFRRDDHHWNSSPGPPHEDLCVVGVGFDHGVGRDRLVFSQQLRLFLSDRLQKLGSFPQRFVRIHLDVQPHAPAHRLQHHQLSWCLVDGHQPCGETLVPPYVAQHGHVALTHRDAPRHARVEIVVHADGEFGVFLGWTHDGAGLRGVAVPGVVHAVRVADGFDFTITEIRKLPARPTDREKSQEEPEKEDAQVWFRCRRFICS